MKSIPEKLYNRLLRLTTLMDVLLYVDDPIAEDLYYRAAKAIEKREFTGVIRLTNKEKYFLIDRILTGGADLEEEEREIISSFCTPR